MHYLDTAEALLESLELDDEQKALYLNLRGAYAEKEAALRTDFLKAAVEVKLDYAKDLRVLIDSILSLRAARKKSP